MIQVWMLRRTQIIEQADGGITPANRASSFRGLPQLRSALPALAATPDHHRSSTRALPGDRQETGHSRADRLPSQDDPPNPHRGAAFSPCHSRRGRGSTLPGRGSATIRALAPSGTGKTIRLTSQEVNFTTLSKRRPAASKQRPNLAIKSDSIEPPKHIAGDGPARRTGSLDLAQHPISIEGVDGTDALRVDEPGVEEGQQVIIAARD